MRSAIASGAGDSYTFFIRKNSADASVTCQITHGNLTCSDTTHCIDFTANTDLIAVRSLPASSPTSLPAHWTAVFHPGETCASLGAGPF
ncbi:MAG: hypothetical protein AB1598_05870 [Thermodesulfobacteriota bacterium]